MTIINLFRSYVSFIFLILSALLNWYSNEFVNAASC